MMDKKRWLWKRKSSEKSPGETESSGSAASSHSERYSDEQEASKESPNGSDHSPDITSRPVAWAEDADNCSFVNAQLPQEVTSKPLHATGIISDDDSFKGENSKGIQNTKIVKEEDLNDGLRNMSEKLFVAFVNANAKEDLVKQHATVAEEAIAGWEKAENEVRILKKQLEAATRSNSSLEDRVTHLDGALKECLRQLRQTREEQEENIHDAVEKKTSELEAAKIKLESKVAELQRKLDASNAKSSIDLDIYHKVEILEKENIALRNELLSQSEDLEIRTIERDLSTQAAETASKQHLESIKKVARLEAECRRLKSAASKTSLVNDHKSAVSSSFCVKSLTDSHSDNGDQLNVVEIDTHKTSCSEPNKCEPSCSDSWASALIAELDQFKNEKCRENSSGSVKIDLMDDFLEMERLAALAETKNENHVQESVAAECVNEESFLRAEFEIMIHQMDELKEKLEKVESEKAKLEIALRKSEESIEDSRLQLIEAENKLEELQEEIEHAYKSKQMVENHLMSMEAEAQQLSAKVQVLEAEIDKEKAASDEIAIKCKDLEEELERKSVKVELLEADVDKKRAMSEDIAMKCTELEEELESKSAKVDRLESEVEKERATSEEIATKYKQLKAELESESAKVNVLELEVDKERVVSEGIAIKCKELEDELEIKKQEEMVKLTNNSYGEKKIKQEDLALAAGKLAECQKTIASLGNQLNSLATLEDFLIDTASIPASPLPAARASGEMWKMHSNDTYSPKRDSISRVAADGSSGPFFSKNEGSSPSSSSSSMSSASLQNHVGSEKSRNGFAKFFSRTKSGIRLEI